MAGEDLYKLEQAKKHLAFTVNRLNLIASPPVLKSTSDLLDFLNEHVGKDFDALRLHNILNTLVIEARRDLNYRYAKSIEDANIRFRFFAPPRKEIHFTQALFASGLDIDTTPEAGAKV
jgi:hypothetical protein